MDLITYALCKNSGADAASAAAASASAAQAAQRAAEAARDTAKSAQSAAEAARDAASGSAQGAASSAIAASDSAEDAQGYADDAQSSAQDAQTAAGQAAGSATTAQGHAQTAQQAAQTAQDAAQALSGIGAEAQTLPPGSDATVTVQDGKIIYGIPAGQPGTGLPDATAEDAGKVPVVGADGSYTLGEPVPEVDTTLTEAGAPADAKAAGDAIAAITPDDNSVGAKPWSSKQIIDALCPPLEESGNPVQCYPVAGYPLGVKATWQPRQAGTGDPSPDNIRAISGMESVTVTRGGKNWFNSSWVHGVRSDDTGEFFPHDGVSSRYTTVERIVPIVGGRTYALSWNGDEQNPASLSSILCYNDSTFLQTMPNPSGGNTFTVPDNANGVAFNLRSRDEFTTNYITNGQLELGSTPTAYAPYTVTTHALTLPETIYGGTVDAVTGVGTEAWECLTLDNPDLVNMSDGGNFFYTTLGAIFGPDFPRPIDPISTADFIASNLKSTINVGNETTGFVFALYSNGIIRFHVDGVTTLEEAKQFVVDNPITIAYRLATPNTISTTPNTVLALSGENVLITNADSLTVTGRADPNHTIQTLSDRIAALESNTTQIQEV